MSNHCPKCRTVSLTPRHAGILRCPQCKGSWIPRNQARLETVSTLFESDSTIRPGENSDDRTGLCPLGHGILIRALVEGEDPFYLDRCPECSGIWFDKGEWAKLANEHLVENLDRLWDSAWRFRTRRDRAEIAYVEQLRAEVGAGAFAHLEALVANLKECSPRIQVKALAFLRESVDED